jgi:hypothetical protein
MLNEDRLSSPKFSSEMNQPVAGVPKRPTEAQRAWVTAVLGVPMASSVNAPADPSSRVESLARLKSLRDDAVLYGMMDGFHDALQEAAAAVKAGDPGALVKIEALESRMAAAAAQRAKEAEAMAARLKTASGANDLPGPDAMAARAPSATRGEEAKALNARGIAYPKLLLRWKNAQAAALSTLQGAGEAYLALPNVQTDPRYARVRQAIAELPELIPDLGDELSDLLDRGINEGSDETIATDALDAVDDYRTVLGGAEVLRGFEGFARKYVGQLSVIETLDDALGEIAHSLEAAL